MYPSVKAPTIKVSNFLDSKSLHSSDASALSQKVAETPVSLEQMSFCGSFSQNPTPKTVGPSKYKFLKGRKIARSRSVLHIFFK